MYDSSKDAYILFGSPGPFGCLFHNMEVGYICHLWHGSAISNYRLLRLLFSRPSLLSTYQDWLRGRFTLSTRTEMGLGSQNREKIVVCIPGR